KRPAWCRERNPPDPAYWRTAMNIPRTLHPSPDRLSLFGTGQLSADEADDVEAHVSDCTGCCEALRTVADDSFVALIRRATPAPDGDSPALLLRHGPQLAPSPDSTPLPSSLERLTSPFPGLPSAAKGTPEGDVPDTFPDPLRDHPRYRIVRLIGRG